MKLMKVYLVLFLGILLCTTTGCKQSEPDGDEEVVTYKDETPLETLEQEPLDQEVDQDVLGLKGSYSDNRYDNEVLDLSFEVPTSWQVLDEAEIAQLFDYGAETMADLEMSDPSAAEVITLFVAYKYPIDQQMLINPSVLIVAEKNHTEDGYGNAFDYLNAIKKTLMETQLPFVIDETATDLDTKNQVYVRLEATLDTGTETLVQSYYVKKVHGYWVTLTFNARTTDGGEMIKVILGE